MAEAEAVEVEESPSEEQERSAAEVSPLADRDRRAKRHHRAARAAIQANAAFSLPYVAMNTLATIVACYGLLADSTAVVIGAMIIALLLGPISGIALALVDGDGALLRRALTAEIGGAALVLVVSFVIGTIHQDIPMTHEMLARTRPNIMDLMIALAGGAAGAYATVSPRLSVGLVGVAIATALVPPLSTCGMCLARHETALAWGGFLLFFTNLVAIQFASSVVMWLNGYHAVTERSRDAQRTRLRLLTANGISFASLTLLTSVMGANFVRTVAQQRFETAVRNRLEKELAAFPGVHLADLRFRHRADVDSVLAVVRTPYSFSPDRVKTLESGLPHQAGADLDLDVMSVIVKETTRDGYLHEEPAAPASPAADGAPLQSALPAAAGASPPPPEQEAHPLPQDANDAHVFGR